ncbi:unnamed protein product [Orchesella dallaii]|uniref:Exonuclease domain-containing protein n=1 Tax=Orchesella dallaii TaxID=48710 RepID=A0ABP1PLU5_9HEXA
MQTRVAFVSGSFLKSGFYRAFLKSQTEIGGKADLRAFTQTRPKLKELKSPTEIVQGWVKSVVGGTSTRSADGVEDIGEFLKRPEGKQIDYDLKRSSSSPLSSAVASNSKGKNRKTSTRMFSRSPVDDKIVWVDCEMTSLEDDGQLMEIGIIITGGNLEEIARHDPIVFKIEDSVLDKMNEWCREHHGKSGLTDSCRTSNITHAQADDQIVSFLEKYTTARECPIAGNSIGIDRIFITKQLPKVHAHLHYRSIDVSSIKELARRWYPADVMNAAPKKRFSHRVMDDIEDSIAELQYYRSAVFIDPKSVKPSQPSNVQRVKAKNTAV